MVSQVYGMIESDGKDMLDVFIIIGWIFDVADRQEESLSKSRIRIRVCLLVS